ncbi:MAG: FHA domain-containing protein [Planctomycetota bacterium]
MALLRVEKGKSTGGLFVVHDSTQPTVLGRDPSVSVSFDDERASRKHARILRAHGHWVIQDLGSRNGTIVGGKPATKSVLTDGSTVQIGATLLRFVEGELPPPPEQEVYGTKLSESLFEESGVVAYRAYQSALDRFVRVDCIADGWKVSTQTLHAIQIALEESQRLSHADILPTLQAELDAESRYTVQKLGKGGLLTDSLSAVLESPLDVRLDLFASLAEIVLERALLASLRTPLSLRQVFVRREGARWIPSISALDFPSLLTFRTGATRHLPAYIPYLPPECVASGERDEMDYRSMVYSLGMVGYHLLAGSPAMGDGQYKKQLENHKSVNPAPLRLVQPDVPNDVSEIIERMIRKDVQERPGAALDILPTLRGSAPDGEALETRTAPQPAADAPSPRRKAEPAAEQPTRRAPKPPAARTPRPSASAPKPRAATAPPRVGFFSGPLSFPIWIGVWIALFIASRVATKLFFERLG